MFATCLVIFFYSCLLVCFCYSHEKSAVLSSGDVTPTLLYFRSSVTERENVLTVTNSLRSGFPAKLLKTRACFLPVFHVNDQSNARVLKKSKHYPQVDE